jgi:hypothetical protein
MKPGYYLSENGNFQTWYPKSFFIDKRQTMEILTSDGWIRVHYAEEDLRIIRLLLEFEFLGDL